MRHKASLRPLISEKNVLYTAKYSLSHNTDTKGGGWNPHVSACQMHGPAAFFHVRRSPIQVGWYTRKCKMHQCTKIFSTQIFFFTEILDRNNFTYLKSLKSFKILFLHTHSFFCSCSHFLMHFVNIFFYILHHFQKLCMHTEQEN